MSWAKAAWGFLRSFTVYYLPQNQRGRLTEVTVASDAAKDKPRTTKLKVKWKVDNTDSDSLVYRLYYREELGVMWRLISGPDPVDKTEFEWDTESVPDGYYRVKVVASDEKDNPESATLADSELSERVLVDNRRPEVAGLSVRFPWAAGIARDSYSPIKRIEYSVDGGPWRLVAPLDGIYDSPAEGFRVHLAETLGPGTHVLAVRALDEADNIGISQARFVK
jgi:hypothetical protein